MLSSLQFSPADLDRFSAASHDVNPLHMSSHYARRTAYGERVVFGVLAAIEALSAGPERPGQVLTSLVLEFPSPVLIGVDYEVSVDSSDGLTAVVSDGRRVLLRARAAFAEGSGECVTAEPAAPTDKPRDLQPEDLQVDATVSGRYAPNDPPYTVPGVAPAQLAALLWSSYLIGMQLPGRRALYSIAEFNFSRAGKSTAIDYAATVSRFHKRFGRLKVEAALSDTDGTFAEVKLEAFIRQDVPLADVAAIESHLPRSSALGGKTALVIGGSRGLGAALVRALALQGCAVRVNYASSAAAATALADELDGLAPIELVQGDATDPAWCAAQAARPVDILICSAFPALLPLWVEPSALDRMTAFMHQAWALTATPLAHFAGGLAEREGTLLLVSTSAVETIVPDWPHYTAAKYAAEGLTRAVAAENPGLQTLIARPPKLWTDLTNTPLGRHGATPIEKVAAAMVERLTAERTPGLTII